MRSFNLNHVSSLGDPIPTGRFTILTISKKRGTSFCSDGMPGCVCFHRHFIKSFVLQVFGDGWHLPRIIRCSLPICMCPTIFFAHRVHTSSTTSKVLKSFLRSELSFQLQEISIHFSESIPQFSKSASPQGCPWRQ